MCAIGGIWTRDGRPADLAALLRLRDAMAQRGPDDVGLDVDGDLGLVHRRLSIIDLSAAGRQPLHGEDGTVRIVFNGEIYNHRALRAVLEDRGHRFTSTTDGEVLVHGWEEWGEALLERLNGMFAFAVWDARTRRLVLARDRLGVKPLYLLRHGRTIAFASELRGLAAAFPGLLAIDWRALDVYLHFGFVPHDVSVYRDVTALPPGHTLTVDADAIGTPRRYWTLRFAPEREAATAEWAGHVRDVLADAVRRRLVSDVPVGVLLSGGVDSSVVAALAREADAAPQAFTIGFAGEDREPDGDVAAARAVAAHLGLRHRERLLGNEAVAALDTLVEAFGVPFGDPSAVPTYHAGALAAEHGAKVVLTGDGGDETFGGYANAQAAYVGALCRRVVGWIPGGGAALSRASALDAAVPETARTAHRVATLLRYAGGDLASRLRWTNGWYGAGLRAVRGPALRDVAGDGDEDAILVRHAATALAADDVERVLHADLAVVLPGDYLVKVDVALMASAVEGRSPFLDVEAVELGARIPLGVKLSPLRSKHLLKRVARDLGLPARPILRRKRGFGAPVGRWLRGPLRERARDAVLGTLPARGVVDGATVRRTWEAVQAGRDGDAARLWLLLCLELWFRACVDRTAPAAASA